ncbi:MAG: peptide deformylase [bacterium]
MLRSKSIEVDKIDKDILEFLLVLRKMMRTHDGVGLAAPQLGKSVRIIATSQWEKGKDRSKFIGETMMINPTITQRSKEMFLAEEACLSVPDVYGYVKRHKGITVEYLDAKGHKQSKKLKDFNATIIQHEIDHLDGILFVDKMVKEKGSKKDTRKEKEKKGKK